MSNNLIVGFSGKTSRPSSTKRFVESVSEALAGQLGLRHQVFHIQDLRSSLSSARSVADLDGDARQIVQTIINAEALVISSPTYWQRASRRNDPGGFWIWNQT
jgi:FMN reductase